LLTVAGMIANRDSGLLEINKRETHSLKKGIVLCEDYFFLAAAFLTGFFASGFFAAAFFAAAM